MSFGIRRFLLLLLSYLKFFYYSLIAPFLSKNISSQKSTSILLIKLDEIGDYILFRNFFKYFRLSNKYQNYNITLIGNIEWKDIFIHFDVDNVDEVYWINKKSFSKNLFYRIKVLVTLSQKTYDTIINCNLSRNFFIDDSIVKIVSAKYKIGSITDLSNQFLWQKNLSDDYYSKLVQIEDNCIFEFDRNKSYLSKILNVQIIESVPSLEINRINKINKIEELKADYAVFYLGGKKKYKIWDSKNFIILAKHIFNNFHFNIVLVGNKNDKKITQKFINDFDNRGLLNYVTKTNLIDAIQIINDAQIMISNDSGLAHIAAALNTRTIIIANGTHLGRFFPYPASNKNVKTIYPPQINNNMINLNYLLKTYKYRSKLNINTINPSSVIDEVNKLLADKINRN